MGFWLTRYTGTGTDDDPFRPAGTDGLRWSSIDLRGDCTKQAGHVLVWTDSGLPNGVSISLGDDPDAPLSLGTIASIEGRLGVVLTDTRLRHILRDLLTAQATPPDDKSRWNPLRRQPNGKRKVHLGPLVDEFA